MMLLCEPKPGDDTLHSVASASEHSQQLVITGRLKCTMCNTPHHDVLRRELTSYNQYAAAHPLHVRVKPSRERQAPAVDANVRSPRAQIATDDHVRV